MAIIVAHRRYRPRSLSRRRSPAQPGGHHACRIAAVTDGLASYRHPTRPECHICRACGHCCASASFPDRKLSNLARVLEFTPSSFRNVPDEPKSLGRARSLEQDRCRTTRNGHWRRRSRVDQFPPAPRGVVEVRQLTWREQVRRCLDHSRIASKNCVQDCRKASAPSAVICWRQRAMDDRGDWLVA